MKNQFDSRMVTLETKVNAIFELLWKQRYEKEYVDVKSQDDFGNDAPVFYSGVDSQHEKFSFRFFTSH